MRRLKFWSGCILEFYFFRKYSGKIIMRLHAIFVSRNVQPLTDGRFEYNF